jgi:hypothetical protein
MLPSRFDLLNQGFNRRNNFFMFHLTGHLEVQRQITWPQEDGIDVRRGDDFVCVFDRFRCFDLNGDERLFIGPLEVVRADANSEVRTPA